MGMKVRDRIVAPSRGTPLQTVDYADEGNAYRFDDCQDYIGEVYILCNGDDMPDASIVIAQSVHETDDWQSHWWNTRLNPAGLGITGDPRQNALSPVFKNGEEAARAQVSHLLVYALSPADAGSLWFRRTGRSIRDDDPRYDDYVAKYGNTAQAETIDELSGTWAVDERYAEKIVARSRAVFPNLPDQKEQPVAGTTTVQIDNRYTTRSYGTLDGPALWITVHNNGNFNSDRFDEARFVATGGGESAVLYHAAADEGGVCAIAALDVKGRHAGNIDGNNTSIAIEMCEGGTPWDAVKENTAQWLAEVVTDSQGVLDYGDYGPKNFSLDRVKEHRDWPGANPGCPRKLIQTDGGVEKVVARAKEIVRSITETPSNTTTAPPAGPTYPNGMDEGIASRLFGSVKGEDGKTYSYNEKGIISQFWLTTSKAMGEFPEIAAVWVYADGRKYFCFHGGLVLWQTNESAPPKVLK